MAARGALSSLAARQFSRSASTIFTREVSGSHKLTIDGYSVSRKIPHAWWEPSQPFEAAGYTWRIKYFPNGARNNDDEGDDDGDGCISLYLELANNGGGHQHGLQPHHSNSPSPKHTDPVQFKFSLLDQAGNPVPGYTRSKQGCVFRPLSAPSIGFDDFVKWEDLRSSGALKDDRFAIRCDITAIRDWPEPEDTSDGDGGGGAPSPVSTVDAAVPPPPSDDLPSDDLHEQLSDLLWKKKHGADVAVDVAGETFDAHGWLLAARSPVLEAELQALTTTTMTSSSSSSKKDKEKDSSQAGRRTLKIKDMEPKVFKAMLRFIYTDTLVLPKDELDAVEMARGLLAAAGRYRLEKLKLICEDVLCRRIEVNTVAAILVAAEEQRCQALKAKCLEFMARPGCLKEVMDTPGFQEMKATCLPLLVELLVKQLA